MYDYIIPNALGYSLLKPMMMLNQMSTQCHNGNCLAILEKIDVDMVDFLFRIFHSPSQ